MPKQTPIDLTSTITIRVGPNFKSEIDHYRVRREMSRSDFIRYAIRFYMDTVAADDI